jgi:MarR family transcriptional regulator for hemolysin
MVAVNVRQIPGAEERPHRQVREPSQLWLPVETDGFKLIDVARLYARRFQRRSRALAFDLLDCRTLLTLAHNQGVKQRRLAELASIDPVTMVRVLDRLQTAGCIRRHPQPGDRRARSIAVTEKGASLLPEISRIVLELQRETFNKLTAQEQQVLTKALDHLLANMKLDVPDNEAP